MTLFILSCVLVVILFVALNKRTKFLILISVCLTIGLNYFLTTTTNNLEYTTMGVIVVAYVFIVLLAGANFISNTIRLSNPKYADGIRKIFTVHSFISAFLWHIYFL